MLKTIFKTMLRTEESEHLKEVKGYFTKINDVKAFTYFSVQSRKWYVVDTETGLSFADGQTMSEAKDNALLKYFKFKEFQKTKDYLQLKSKYRKMSEK